VPHAGLRTFENSGNALVGLATRSLGSTKVEIWRSNIAVGSRTPMHTHDSDEVFIVLTGSGVIHVGERALPFQAPATVIAPGGVAHWVENTGTVPTDQIVVVAAGSTITGADGRVMDLPWRR
jgi:mannose-6-phosphate isomerase-like protein (cupin superfamily)